MKRLLSMVLLLLVGGGMMLLGQDINAGPDYTKALEKKGGERIRAFEEYIAKYPDTSKHTFTKYAYYWLALELYNQKKYDEAMRNADKGLAVGIPDKKNEAELNLILASCHGVKGNKDQAIRFADKAISLAKAENLANIVKNAEAVKRELSGPAQPQTKLTPVQKFQWQYQEGKYAEAIASYAALPESDRKNQLNAEAYADSLLQLKRTDEALQKFEECYRQHKKGQVALRLAEIYMEKAKRDKTLIAKGIDYYVEASVLFGKENSSKNQQAAMQKAKYEIGEKYNYNKRAADLNRKMPKNQPAPANNKLEIRKLELEIQRKQNEIDDKYADMEPPAFELDKIKAMQKKLDQMKSGAAPKPTDPALAKEAEELEKDKAKIDAEFGAALDKAKKKLGM